MSTKKLFSLLFLLYAFTANSQKNFQMTPEKPKAGDLITFTYEPAGDIANTMQPVEGVVYTMGSKGQTADDITLKKEGKKYTGTIQTDTSQNFIYLGFSSDKKFDNNYNTGYWVQLLDNDKVKKGSNLNLSSFYQYYGGQVGVERNNEKALEPMENEMKMYPETRKANMPGYLRLMVAAKKPDATALVQKEIETTLKQGLKDESDYVLLENLYAIAKSPEQGKLITNLKKEKYPNGKWVVNETMQKFYAEADPAKKEQLLAQILQKVETDENWKYLQPSVSGLKSQLPYAYLSKKDWDGFKKSVESAGLKPSEISQLYNSAAWEMQKTSDNLKLAEEMSRIATTQAKNDWLKPTGEKPAYATQKQWEKSRESTYGMFADTYGMVMYRMGEYKKGLPYAQDAALKIQKGMSADENNTYALLAEKVLPVKEYKKQLEQFVKDGKTTSEIKDALKRAYVKETKSEAGYDTYISALEKETYMKMLTELRKSMMNETAPSFALLDLDGKKVNITDLKGKVVVVDFWATWCGPCKASFPGMQKMVTRYKENPDVKFVFVDTWERVEEKEKNVAEFITANKYTFHVLMDNESKVVEQFKVDGIPTKFVIDKDGMIRFKAVGFNGSDDKLISELTAMIEMAGDPSKKAF